MSVVQHFCARESLSRGDPLAGSGAHAERNLLLSWPRAKWRRNLRQASDMPEEIAARLAATAESGRRVNLIHRRDWPAQRHCLYLMPENRRFEVPRDELSGFLASLDANAPLTRWETASPQCPLLLCCTHGKKDKCCAKFGNAAYQALSKAVAMRGFPIEVWESTHLGGCRLAASAVVFPALRKYGRIASEDVVPLLESELANTPYLPCYRGDSRLTPVQQCAQVAALEWLADRRVKAVALTISEPPDAQARSGQLMAEWHADEDSGRLVVTCQGRPLQRFDTCADLDAGTLNTGIVWKATDIREVASPTLALADR